MAQALAGSDVELIVAGFSPATALHEMAEQIGLTGPVLVDEQRVLYRLLGLGRAPLWRVYTPGTLAFYHRARRQGQVLTRPVEDTRQLGGDALLVDGTVVRVWRPRSPDDRVGPDHLAAVARAVAAR